MNLKIGNEYLYQASKNVDPVWLTYISEMKNGLHRFFSSEFPTLEYHISSEKVSVESPKDYPLPSIAENYIAFKGDDSSKEKAYLLLLKRRHGKDF